MATRSNEQQRRNRPFPRRLILGPVHASRGLGRATVKVVRLIGRIPVSASQRTRTRVRALRTRGVATVRQSITTTRRLPARAARKITRRPTPAEPARVEAGPAEPQARATTRRTRQRRATSQQGKPRQARRTQALEQYTVRELRERARKAGIEGRSSMTREQLIKALRDHR